VCKGNVGKPAGKFIWKKQRHGQQSPIIYSDVSTTTAEIPANCTFYGTSNLTIQLTDLDNKAKIQCVQGSNLSSNSLSIETEYITVYCKFQINIIITYLTKSADQSMYCDCFGPFSTIITETVCQLYLWF